MSSLKDLILDAKYDDIDEATTSGDVAGYGTPFAFGDGSEKSKKKKKKNATNSTGYEIVENINLIKEEISVSDFNKIRDLIRTELSKVFFDLFKKRNMWI